LSYRVIRHFISNTLNGSMNLSYSLSIPCSIYSCWATHNDGCIY